jgi:signal transduction histidine kinase
MKPLQLTPTFSKKRSLRALSPEAGAFPSLNANVVQRSELRPPGEPPRLLSPVISRATKNIGQTLYEMLGMAELMRVAYEKGELAAVQSRLSLLMRGGENLASSISSVLEFTKLEKGPVKTACERFDIVSLLNEVSETARSIVGDKPVAVMDVSCPGPVVIYSDPSLIRQIMTGLMHNAAKFTARGRIAIILCRDDDKIRLTVADTGKGMPPEQIHAVLTSPGLRHDDELNGLPTPGLGLRIVKALVKKLDGVISLSSKPGEGTIVEVSLPLKPPL